MKIGVSQGDCLFPILFNMTLDGAVKEFKRSNIGIKIGKQISIIDFAYDVYWQKTKKNLVRAEILIK